MFDKKITTSDGITRTVSAKVFGDEIRVYKVYGDVTKDESTKEMYRILAETYGVSKVIAPRV